MLPGLPGTVGCATVPSFTSETVLLTTVSKFVLPGSLSQLSFLPSLAAIYNSLVRKDKINNESSSKILTELGAVVHTHGPK